MIVSSTALQETSSVPIKTRVRSRVLIVDDDLLCAQTLGRLLENEGYKVLALGNSTKAIDLGPKFLPHAAILDLAMPIVDGITLCAHLRQSLRNRAMRLFAISGRDYTREEIEAAGFDRLFIKPLDWPALKDALAASDSQRRD